MLRIEEQPFCSGDSLYALIYIYFVSAVMARAVGKPGNLTNPLEDDVVVSGPEALCLHILAVQPAGFVRYLQASRARHHYRKFSYEKRQEEHECRTQHPLSIA